jgi:hypothetical protein
MIHPGHGSHGKSTATAKEAVEDQWRDTRVQSRLGWKTREHRIGHALRHEHNRHDHLRQEVSNSVLAAVMSQPDPTWKPTGAIISVV